MSEKFGPCRRCSGTGITHIEIKDPVDVAQNTEIMKSAFEESTIFIASDGRTFIPDHCPICDGTGMSGDIRDYSRAG